MSKTNLLTKQEASKRLQEKVVGRPLPGLSESRCFDLSSPRLQLYMHTGRDGKMGGGGCF